MRRGVTSPHDARGTDDTVGSHNDLFQAEIKFTLRMISKCERGIMDMMNIELQTYNNKILKAGNSDIPIPILTSLGSLLNLGILLMALCIWRNIDIFDTLFPYRLHHHNMYRFKFRYQQ